MLTNQSIGYIDAPIPKGLDLKEEINRMRREKNAVILAHYYQTGDIQDIADFVGDSLALAQQAAKTTADIIVFCGVHFMGETAKVLCPDKEFVKQHPGHVVISYVNTTAAVKAVTDVVVTSTNARQIVESFPEDTKIIFGPDRNLGNYINGITGRKMLLWDGACHVHEQFSLEKILELKKQYPDAEVITHPECKQPVVQVSDFVGSTAALLKHTVKSDKKQFIVATESGVIHEMRKQSPDKEFIPAPPNDSTCACNECNFMRLNTMEKLYNCLKYELPEIFVDEQVQEKAIRPIKKMLEISERLGL